MNRREVKDKPLVSVIIPTHNRARLLPEALDSVLNQEGAGEEFDMEVVVVDDASSDETPEVMRGYPKIRYLRFDTNRGVSAARNTGVKASSGPYVAFLDDDDVWLPQKLRLQVPVIETHREAGVVYSQIVLRFEGSESLEPRVDKAGSGMIFRDVLMGFFFPYIPNLLIRREAFDRAGMFDETFRHHEDYEFTARLAFHVPFVFVPGPVCIYRFSRQDSKWISSLLRFGGEQPFRGIEKALTMLPDSGDYAGMKLEARARGNLGHADDLAIIGEFDRMREYMRTGLEMFPGLFKDEWACRLMTTMAARLSQGSHAPIAAVRDFCADVRGAAAKPVAGRKPSISPLLAEIWKAVAIQLSSGVQPSHRQAGYAAMRAMLYNPFKVSPALLGTAVRGVLGTRAYAFLTVVKHILCGEL